MRRLAIILLSSLPAIFATTEPGTARQETRAALETIAAEDLRAHLRLLSHDLLEGRAPGTRGGRLALLYLSSEFQRIGLAPVDGGFIRPVPLVGITNDMADVSLDVEVNGEWISEDDPERIIVWSGRAEEAVTVEGEVVFVGYGVRAPEYDWDDFGDAELEGRILLILVGDPPAPPEDPDRFDGRAMTVYGRWSYKLAEAARRGAAGAIIVHTVHGAGYTWDVVRRSWSGERLSLPRLDDAPDPLALEGWIRRDLARELLARAGQDLDELYVRAARGDFRPVYTGITLRAEIPGTVRRFRAANVLGLVPGSDPELRDEFVVYTAHYDHLGVGPAVDGDSIYNGAYDNASGTALLLEVAEAFASLETAPRRSILFLATTAEEAGMLGAEHYVREPPLPLESTAAVINVDGANLWGETADAIAIGARRSSLGDVVREQASAMEMTLTPTTLSDHNLFFRSDQFPFARAGVPAIRLEHGLDYRGRPDGWGARNLARYQSRRYHGPADEYDPQFDLSGAVQQARLAFRVGLAVANGDDRPRWHEGGRPGFDR